MSKVNIVMLAKDRQMLTRQAVESLFANTPRELYNLTIVDDQSNPQLLDGPVGFFLNTTYYRKNIDWTLLRNERSKGITGQARNLGVYWAQRYWGRGEYLYLTDNDVYFRPGWLETLTTVLAAYEVPEENKNCRIIGGWNHPFLQPSHDREEGMIWGVAGRDLPHVRMHDAVAGASQLMRWSTWDIYGPLDAHAVGVGQSEDWKFCQDIIKEGGRVGSIYPRVVLNCGVTNSFGQASPGADIMVQELMDAKRNGLANLYWE